MLREARGTVSLAERLAHDLHPLTAFVVVPLFALANAGVTVDRDALAGRAGAVLAGILVGRVVGKPAGIVAAVWLAVRLGLVTTSSRVGLPSSTNRDGTAAQA
jgi:NhaA family Na+:H+ antiporter